MPQDWASSGEASTDRHTESASVGPSANRREVLLAVLSGVSEPISLPNLARSVAIREATGGTVSSTRIQQTYLSLYQEHVVELSAAGLIRYRDEDGTVELTAAGRRHVATQGEDTS